VDAPGEVASAGTGDDPGPPVILVHVNGDAGVPGSRQLLTRGVRAVLEREGVEEGEVSVTLLPDPEIRELNRRYLGHDRVTDVLSFALNREGEPPLGDLYLGVEEAARQAAEAGVALEEELLRLAVHGTLHLLGWDHPEGEERLGSEMFQLQEALVAALMAEEGP